MPPISDRANDRRLSKDDEFLPATEENLIHLALNLRMLRRLCRSAKSPPKHPFPDAL